MSLDILGDGGFPERNVEATATLSRSVPEGITPNQRDETWYAMTKELMAALDKQLEQRMRDNFTFYVQ
jgi:hypothetical protein